MNRWRQRLLPRPALLAALAVLTVVATPATPAAASSGGNSAHRFVTVMTRNLDEGTDFKLVLGARTPAEFVAEATATYQEVVDSSIPERAAAVAREIASTRPELVSVQEASVWRTTPLMPPAVTTVTFDALQSLEDALAADGARYAPVVVVTEVDIAAPTLLGFAVRVTDLDAILARTDLPPGQLTLSNVRSGHFSTLLTIPTVAGPVTIPRGWASVEATIRGRTLRFIATHLESFSAGVQRAQGQELAGVAAGTTLPVVLAGDLNTGPGVTPTYADLLAAGFVDTWSVTHPGDPGFTNPLHGEDPFTPFATPDQRIDLVLLRGRLEPSADFLVGNGLGDLTPSGLWPSDHAGVVARVRVPS